MVLGDTAAGTFLKVFDARDRLLVDQDVLCVGPTPSCDDLDAWKSLRDQFWNGIVPGGIDAHVQSPLNLVDNRARLRDAEHVTIWAATSVSEQLFIARTIHLMDLVGADTARLSFVQFATLRSRPNAQVLGIGELNEQQLAEHPEPTLPSPDQLADYRDAWSALTSPDPGLLASFSASHPNANPWIRRAMQLMLRRFPDKQSGLPYWDRTLLEVVREHGPRAARVIGHALTREWDDADLTGDWYLFGRLVGLGSLPVPLIELTGDRTNMRSCEVRLSPFGTEVLEGRASSFPVNPIEDWVAGVKQSSSRGPLWFSDAGKLSRAPRHVEAPFQTS